MRAAHRGHLACASRRRRRICRGGRGRAAAWRRVAAAAWLAVAACAAHFPRVEEPAIDLEPLAIGVPLVKDQLFEAQLPLHLFLHDGLDRRRLMDDGGFGAVLTFSFVTTLRMETRGSGGPFIEYRFGRDDLNIRFEERRDVWVVGYLVEFHAPPTLDGPGR